VTERRGCRMAASESHMVRTRSRNPSKAGKDRTATGATVAPRSRAVMPTAGPQLRPRPSTATPANGKPSEGQHRRFVTVSNRGASRNRRSHSKPRRLSMVTPHSDAYRRAECHGRDCTDRLESPGDARQIPLTHKRSSVRTASNGGRLARTLHARNGTPMSRVLQTRRASKRGTQ